MERRIKRASYELNTPEVERSGPSLEFGDVDMKTLEEVGLKLHTVFTFSQFWLGDWAAHVEDTHGKHALTRLCRLIGLEVGEVRKMMKVSRRFTQEDRQLISETILTWRHYFDALDAPSPEFAIHNIENQTPAEFRAQLRKDKARRRAAHDKIYGGSS